MKSVLISSLFSLILCLFAFMSFAVEPIYPFESAEQKLRFEHLVKSYRCVVCANQTLAESEATLAQDLRQVIYQKVKNNETDDHIDQYLKQRFGQFIEYKPAFSLHTLLLWLGPVIFLMIGLLVVLNLSKRELTRKTTGV